MLRYALIFLVLALFAGFLVMRILEGVAIQIAHVLFVVFLVIFIISLVTGRRPPIA